MKTIAIILLLIIHLFGHGQYDARCKNDKITCRRNGPYLNENSPYHIFLGILRENSLAKTILNSCPCKIENVSTKIIYINDKFYTIRSQIIFSNTAKLNITFVLFKAGNEFKITAISNNI
jgi:hypothetical protein